MAHATEDRPAVRLLTTYSAISAGVVAALLATGFVIHARLAQLLGIDLPSAPTDYATVAGDFLTSLVVRVFAIARGDLTMTSVHVLTLLAALIAIAVGVLLRRDHPAARRRIMLWLWITFSMTAGIALVALILSSLRMRNVLQPANHTHRIQRLQTLAGSSDTVARQRAIIGAYKHPASTLHDPIAAACFNPASGNTAAHRQNLYTGTILVSALVLLALLMAPKDRSVVRLIALSIAWGAVLLSLPIAYATFGRDFTYPIARVTQGTTTYCGYLLASDTTSITLYDRPGGFRLRRIPREELLIDQLGVASPFQGCGPAPNDPQGFLPCETLFCTP